MLANFDAEREFLQAIAESPEDDTHRLIYADWLEEQGDPRSELVRVQVEIANLGEFADPKLLHPLKEREDELWGHLRRIREHFYSFGAMDFQFRQGVLEGLGIKATDLISNADAIFHDAPALNKLDLWAISGLLDEVRSITQFQQIQKLRIGGRFEGHDVRDLKELLTQSNVTELELSFFWVDHEIQLPSEFATLLRRLVIDRATSHGSFQFDWNFNFPVLEELRFPKAQLTTRQVNRLLAAINPDQLRILDLDETRLTAETLDLLTDRFPNLDTLSATYLRRFDNISHAVWLPNIKHFGAGTYNAETLPELMQLPLESVRVLSIQLSSDVAWSVFSKCLCESELTPRLYHIAILNKKISQKQFDSVCDQLTQVPGWEAGSKRTLITDVGRRTF